MTTELKSIADKAEIPAEQVALSGQIHILSVIIGSIAKSVKEALAQKKVSLVGVRMAENVDNLLADSKDPKG
jgi:hypothetical protein